MIQQYSFDNGKYVIKRAGDGTSMMAYRHGEFWQNMTGDNMTMCMLDEIDELRAKVEALESQIEDYYYEARERDERSEC